MVIPRARGWRCSQRIPASSGRRQPSREPDQDQGPALGRSRDRLYDIRHPPDQLEGHGRLAFLLYPSGLADAGVDLGQLAVGFHGAGGTAVWFSLCQ